MREALDRPDGEYRRDVMQRLWVVKESTDASGKKVPPQAK